MTEEISENVSTAAISTTFEKVRLDLDLDVPEEQEWKPTNQSLTPRSSRMPESVRTLADIPEDLSESHAQNKSAADASERTSSRRSQTDRSDPSYTDDFSSTAHDKNQEKLSSEDSRKSRSSKSEADGNSTEDDISEEILSVNDDSHSESEIEEVKDVQILTENADTPPGDYKCNFFYGYDETFVRFLLLLCYHILLVSSTTWLCDSANTCMNVLTIVMLTAPSN